MQIFFSMLFFLLFILATKNVTVDIDLLCKLVYIFIYLDILNYYFSYTAPTSASAAVQVTPAPPGTAPTANVAVQATGGPSAPVQVHAPPPPSATVPITMVPTGTSTSTVPTPTVAVQATTPPSTTVQVALTAGPQQTTPTDFRRHFCHTSRASTKVCREKKA